MKVTHRPKFKISRDAAVFTIGSCFAREIETALQSYKIPLLLAGHGVLAERYESWRPDTQTGGGVPAGTISRGVFHKYTTHSMFFDVERAIQGNLYPNEGLLELEPDLWFDPHAAGLQMADKTTALDSRAKVDAGMQTIKQADVVIVTLGLTESWREKVNGQVMNRAPAGKYLLRKGDLFELLDFGYDDIQTVLRQMIDMIVAERPAVKIIISVSPIPSSTFGQRDVVSASVGSKAMLRTAAETVSRIYDFVDYFPSYEMVTLSPRALAWEEDAVHVQRAMVRSATDTFVDSYYNE